MLRSSSVRPKIAFSSSIRCVELEECQAEPFDFRVGERSSVHSADCLVLQHLP